MSPAPALIKFWQTDLTRECFLSHTAQEERRTLRLVCHDFADSVAPVLFSSIHVSFGTSTFTKPSRMAALERIGHHCRTLTFSMPHSSSTFLPPLLDPVTGVEQDFVYHPQFRRTPSRSSGDSQYGSWDVTDLLVKQYPPLFHAATNVFSFIDAISSLPCLRHLHISTPDQPPAQRYRRSAVDYALISLRIAIEQIPLPSLTRLTLSPIHPSAIAYLRPTSSFGCTPSSPRRWSKIKHLAIHMSSLPPSSSTDHLKHLHTYLQTFSSLTTFHFTWLPSPPSTSSPSPFPLTLSTEPSLTTPHPLPLALPTSNPKTFSLPPLRPLLFPSLTHLSLTNALVDAHQISSFIHDHRRSIATADFHAITLRSGTWEDALAPLTAISGNDAWKRKPDVSPLEFGDIPIKISGEDLKGANTSVICEEEIVEIGGFEEDETRSGSRRRGKRRKGRGGHGAAESSTVAGSSSGAGSAGLMRRAGERTRGMLACGAEHGRRLWKNSVFSWR
ncbi:MAG: hypothetical protein Q9227_000534 [Pyrenula ochraceoflavens]